MSRGDRIFDLGGALLLLALALPLLLAGMLAIWLGDGRSPFYRARRVGQDAREFTMFKLRTMVPGADALGPRLAPEGDPRVTRAGAWLRRAKIDELPQLWNVVRGEMRLVGPRPDLAEGVALYSEAERQILAVRPGITDLASLLFFHEGRLLAGVAQPMAFYLAAIRPIKAELALLYIGQRSIACDLRIIAITMLSFVAPARARDALAAMLRRFGADGDLVALCRPDQLASRSASPAVPRGWSGQIPRVS